MTDMITLPDDLTLYPYQIDTLNRQIKNFIALNHAYNDYEITVCPKCGSTTASFIKAGFTNYGKNGRSKQMYRCSECGKRFVKDNGQLSWYSQQDSSKWAALIIATNNGVSLEQIAAEIDVTVTTAFHMRHKYLHFIKTLADEAVLSNEVELDEKYVQESHKGTKIEGVKGRKRGAPAKKRGLSNEQVCISSGVQRQGTSFLKCFNRGNPSSDDLTGLEPNLKDGSFVWTDGKTSYRKVLEDRHCSTRVVKDHTTYNAVDHLNNVNYLHSMIEKWYEKARGVATKYINRYCALWSLMYIFRDCDKQETLLKVLSALRGKTQYFRIRQISREDMCLI